MSAKFQQLKTRIEQHRRNPGYYIVDFSSLHPLLGKGLTQEEVLDCLFEQWDTEAWPATSQRPQDQRWGNDFAVPQAEARAHTVEALIGGPPIGHIRQTIKPALAAAYFAEFEELFDESRNYYIGMGLGDPAYAYQHGLAIVDYAHAGILWIVEGD